MPRSVPMLAGLTDASLYEKAEIRLVYRAWYSSVPYGDASAHVLPSVDYRVVITSPDGAQYLACGTRQSKTPSILFQNLNTGEAVRIKTSRRMRRLWNKLLWRAEWANDVHIGELIEAGTFKRPYQMADDKVDRAFDSRKGNHQ